MQRQSSFDSFDSLDDIISSKESTFSSSDEEEDKSKKKDVVVKTDETTEDKSKKKDVVVKTDEATEDKSKKKDVVVKTDEAAEEGTLDVAIEIITIENLKEKYKSNKSNKIIINEVNNVFSNATKIYKYTNVKNLLNEVKINNEFNEVFPAKKVIENNIYVYGSNKQAFGIPRILGTYRLGTDRSIKIVCSAYFITNKIIIASRLHEKHIDDEKKLEQSGGVQKKDNMMNILNRYIDGTNKLNNIEDNVLTDDFKNELNDILALKNEDKIEFAKNSTVYQEIVINDNSITTDIDKYFIKFYVNFNIIYDKKKDSIYYSINTEEFNTKIKRYTGKIFVAQSATDGTQEEGRADEEGAAAQEAAVAEVQDDRLQGAEPEPEIKTEIKTSEVKLTEEPIEMSNVPQVIESNSTILQPQKEFQQDGGKRKLKRKELNTMSLDKLKQLHKVNKIKMNNNRTIKSLINNYIKNYK